MSYEPPSSSDDDTRSTASHPPCVLAFNAGDPSGAGGLTADVATVAAMGGHPAAVVTGAYVRDTERIYDHFSLDDEAVHEQARTALEDLPVQAIKVGFVGSVENLSAIAELAADYAELPVVSYMPHLSWWQEPHIDQYLDAFRELLLPQTSVLVGNHSTLWRWLLPDWSGERSPTARDIAAAAADMGVPYTLVTGIPLPAHHVENVLASPETVHCHVRCELFDATFTGAGDTLSAALAALLACGTDLTTACTEALSFLDRCLEAGFRPGMGHAIPDRMFWAEPEDGDPPPPEADKDDAPTLEGYGFPCHDTKH
ncbi:MAG: hydroxymethylpyrimidine/phosphomethylpyrimidine kinase [Burkholderiales bacterium]|nr:hydroxymethylpyrimidine/phosphomethylpyrimidine kinase [Burkholderiales bacterium]